MEDRLPEWMAREVVYRTFGDGSRLSGSKPTKYRCFVN
jgi:hypothetical protein